MLKRVIITLVTFGLLAAPALAENKIACVDLQKVLRNSKAGAVALQQMQEQKNKYEEEFKKRQADLNKLKEELATQTMMLSDSGKAQKEYEFQVKGRELQRFQQDAQEDLKWREAMLTKQILSEAVSVVQKVGKQGGYSVILEKNEEVLLFVDPENDLTEQVIQAYDAGKK